MVKPLDEITESVITKLHEGLHSLGCLEPTVEPRVSTHIPEIIAFIEELIKNGYAYVSSGNVLFSAHKYDAYGKLSNRKIDEMIEGSRIEVEDYKRHPMDFVLWKPTKPDEKKLAGDGVAFDSPWGFGRPGWHIECSAMSMKHLGKSFDVHGGGVDLLFPHHENEIAQSRCYGADVDFAKYWIHNGMLTVDGRKMSKSLGNIIKLSDIDDPMALRYFYLTVHYRKPIDFTYSHFENAKKSLDFFEKVLYENITDLSIDDGSAMEVISPLMHDMNTPLFFANMRGYANEISSKQCILSATKLKFALEMLGVDLQARAEYREVAKVISHIDEASGISIEYPEHTEDDILAMLEERASARFKRDWKKADDIRFTLKDKGYDVQDGKGKMTASLL